MLFRICVPLQFGGVLIDVPLPGNQDPYNSCAAWSVCYGMLGYNFRFFEGHNDYNGYDRNFSPNFIWNQLNGHKNEAIKITSALKLAKEQGCCKLTDMPITVAFDLDPSSTAKTNAANYKLTDYYRFTIIDVDKIKHYLYKGYPVIIGVIVDKAFQLDGEKQFIKQNDGRLVWKDYKDNERFKHAVLICGYDDAIKAFKILNSWGSKWGNNGFIWIDYDFFKTAISLPIPLFPEIYVGFIKRPILSNNTLNAITNNTAQCGGTITADWGLAVTDRGVCWSTSTNPTINDSKTSAGTGKGSFSSTLINLTATTKYYVKAYAINSAGISYGTEQSFTTGAIQISLPILSTSALSSLTQNTAISGGNVTSDGNAQITARGICWSTSPTPITSDNKTTDGIGVGNFTSNITGLTANTTYFVRAYATNSAGTNYGNQLSFKTPSLIITSIEENVTPASGEALDFGSKKFYVIAGSWGVYTNALGFKTQLLAENFLPGILVNDNGLYRVSAYCTDDLSEALAKAEEIRQKFTKYSDVWILIKKN